MMDNNKNKTVGLITYHAAYNFGSVLQTYGTIQAIEELGYKVETIDYRTWSQEFWYKTDFSRKKGMHSMIENWGFNFIKKYRKIRAEKFERFISDFLNTTSKKLVSYLEIKKQNFNYPIMVSGSDQIWNIGCGEFQYEPHEAILPYFLQFGNPKKKIAYASSFGGQSLRNVRNYKDLLCSYDHLSTREPIIRDYMEKVCKRKVHLVCDPTWLLDKEEWLSIPGIYKPNVKHPYIFVYALYWDFMALKKWLPAIKEFASKNSFDVYCVSPLNYHKDNEIHMLQDAGPLDFLSYLANASFVITNTFHGTIFSMNFEIPFYSCCVQPCSRQGQMLAMCDLEDRIINSPDELRKATDITVDFNNSTETISSLRGSSKAYLEKALEN